MLVEVEVDHTQEVAAVLEGQALEAMVLGLLQGQMRRLLILVLAVGVVLEVAPAFHLQVEMVLPVS